MSCSVKLNLLCSAVKENLVTGNYMMDLHIGELNREDYLFELGKTRSLSGNFTGAIQFLEEVSQSYIQQKNYPKYMECLSLLLRIYKELQDTQKMTLLKEELKELVWENDLHITPRVHYTLGLCAEYMGNFQEALEEFEKSTNKARCLEEQALKNNNSAEELKALIESCFPISGMISLLVRENKVDQAQQELANLSHLLNSFKILDKNLKEGKRKDVSSGASLKDILKNTSVIREKLELNTHLLKVTILRLQKKYSDVEKMLWDCYECIQKSRDLCSIVTFFYYLGQNYLDMREYSQAGIFLNLAKKSIDYDNFRQLYMNVQQCLNQFNSIISNDYDLIVNLSTNSIVEKHKGKIDFKNQFILLSLLKVFLFHPGKNHSKENLVEQVWKQKYDPKSHDNKLYVTIKRLRELLEPDTHHVRYIFCGKDGYYLNNNVRVLFKEQTGSIYKKDQEAVL